MQFSSAADVIEAWLAAVNARDLDAILGLYAVNGVLLATFSPHVIRGEAEIRRYFEQLASRPGLGVSLHGRSLSEQRLSEASRVLAGIYSFRFEVEGEPITFASRFTFVLDLGGVRPIIHHHSSQIPRALA